MPFKKLGADRYEGPTGKVFNAAQVKLYYANGGKFPGEKADNSGGNKNPIALRDAKLPHVALPHLDRPEVAAPHLPKVGLPKTGLPKTGLPRIGLKKIGLPKL